ncbi:MAG: 2Fe-2S iron-sulfur cluster-binding protein [Bacillota bacterium]
MKVVLKIYRFDPEKDRCPYFQNFTVSVAEQETVLDALAKAREQDPGLSFRRSCRSAICGSCAVAINGKPSLACHTLIRDAAGGEGCLTVEPLPHFRQIKDLVVDLDPFFESLKAVLPWILTRPEHDGRMSPEAARAVEGPATCILCGICNAALEVPGEAKPAALVKGLRLALDPRDTLGAARLRLMNLPPEVLSSFANDLKQKCPKKIILQEKF